MRKVAIPLAILALIGLDQWVKHWVVANIAHGCEFCDSWGWSFVYSERR